MTNKEIEVQRALGTLPLWKRIQLGEVEFTEIKVGRLMMQIACEGINEHYSLGELSRSNRHSAIRLLTIRARRLKL
ncbi:hypothetical protein LCGC14_1461460 [marine sediment metagenome]|uniref:Uncharacterized protein n=1 Tax=marine sediment metagenome TaxID=412755 RepID=A0A0F9LVL7_9ZZZZ